MNDGSGSSGNGALWAMVGCGALLFAGLCVALGAGVFLALRSNGGASPVVTPAPAPVPTLPQPIDPTPAEAPIVLEATITQVTGSLSGRVSKGCRMSVEHVVDQGPTQCRTQIVCDSLLVYGGDSAGYFVCRFDAAQRLVSGVDQNTTAEDRDAAMTIDTPSRTLRVHDDASGPHGEFTLTGTF